MGISNDLEARLMKSKLLLIILANFSALKRKLNNFPIISYGSNVLRYRLCDSKLEVNRMTKL
jgi:hypothetical protein